MNVGTCAMFIELGLIYQIFGKQDNYFVMGCYESLEPLFFAQEEQLLPVTADSCDRNCSHCPTCLELAI